MHDDLALKLRLLSQLPGLVLVVGPGRNIVFQNQGFENLPPKGPSQWFKGRNQASPSQDTIFSACDFVLESGIPESFEASVREAGKIRLCYQCNIVPLFNEQRKAIYALAHCLDITEIKTSSDLHQREVQRLGGEMEKKLFQALDVLPVGIFVFSTDGKPYYFNKRFETFYGKPASHDITVNEVSEYFQLYVAGTDQLYPAEQLPVARALRGETHVTIDDMEFVKDGRRVPLQVSAEPVFNQRGEIEFALGIFLDISNQKKQNEDLKSSLSLLHATLESTADGILVVDQNGKIAIFNQRFLELWNLPYSFVEIRRDDQPLLLRVTEQMLDPDAFLARVKFLYADPKTESYDVLELKDGRVFERYSRPRKIAGHYAGRVWSFRDVTARVRAERALRQSEAFKTAVLDSALDAIITMNDRGQITEMNPAAERMFGYDRQFAVGRDLAELIIPKHLRTVHRNALARYLDTGQSHILNRRVEFPAMRSDGSQFPVEIGIVRIKAAGPALFTAFVRDVSERKLKNQRIQEYTVRAKFLADASRTFAEARLDLQANLQSAVRWAAEFFQDGSVIRLLSEDGSRLEVSAFYHVDAQAQKLMKAHMSQVSTPWDHQIIRELHTLKKPIRLNGTVEQLRSWVNPHLYSAFALFPVESWILVPLRIAGELIGTLSVFRFGKDTGYTPEDEDFLQDLADRAALALNNAQLYYRAQKAIQLREDFMSIASHELKTPLTPLKMQLQLLTTFVTSGIVSAGAQGQALLKLIEASDQQIVRLSRLVEDMLDTSRISTGKLSLNREEVDLAELAHSVVERFHSLLASAKCHVQIVSHGDAHGKWDRLRIEQIINNLLSNAIKYGAGKPITITVSSQPGRAFLEVQDQGIGINRSDLGRIFERFERAVSVDRFGGLGLGLYISNQIVKAHGGTIRVESEPGKGSRFIVELPSELAQIKRVA